ncbi:probable serine/threonine-protein kinase DDB_G0282963 [Phymastichus coffea]|uniref:probable serine/threonine-protein kinase DDB_G0282963 n=1 Tax=Phymastichus coffea TaxID=108790 RepID=UPI00273B796B|nr:probable serine/threonine-protein kinase DDB_G0282963 [Phymastichus coffea]
MRFVTNCTEKEMSDLIDFDSPSTSSPGAQMLASPLIPSPEAGPPVSSGQRRSVENNPFDMVLKKITEYEKNKEDPFERVIEKAMGHVSIETKDDFVPRRKRHSDILKLNKTLDETESKMDLFVAGVDDSIITNLNDTNLIADNITGEKSANAAWGCDNKIIPELNVSPASCDADLSILNQSALNDSLLDDQLTKEPSIHFFVRPRSMSQCNFLSPERLTSSKSNRRSMSVTDASKSNIYNVSSIFSSQSSCFEDPFNNAFRTNLKSNISSNASSFNSQFDISKQKIERLNSDSSVFSGISNISSITIDSLSKKRQNRLCSENSVYSNISNLSAIPNNTMTSCNSSVFVNDTMNKGFITSRSQLNSTSSVSSFKSPSKVTDKSDLIKKFYRIKSSMSSSHEEPKSNNAILTQEKDNFLLKSKTLPIDESLHKIEGELIDVGYNSATISANETGINDIILTEARTLAETFEKMAYSKDFNTNEDDLLFSKSQLNFDDLPPSDDEAVDNLIELSGGETEIKKLSEVIITESNTMSPKDEVKALENEFILSEDTDKKAVTATLLLDLEKLIKEQNNPDAFKILTDLQKMLGVECDNNTEILQVCLQNMSPQDKKEHESDTDSSKVVDSASVKNVKPNNYGELTGNNKNNAEQLLENKSNNSSNDITDLNIDNESKDIPSDNVDSQSDAKKESKLQENNDEILEDKKLALNLLQTLNKIVSKNDGDSAVDILKSLSTVLNMASESKNKEKPVPVMKENRRSNASKLINRSTSSLNKSSSKKNFVVKKTPNSTFEVASIRRSISVNPLYSKNSPKLLDVPCKDTRKSHLLNLKKRFPSDPGFVDDTSKREIETPISKSIYGANKPTIEPIKTKIKKKPITEVVNKKGPMKAIMPLVSMQKQGVKRITNENGLSTPPSKTQESVHSVKIISSTPNSRTNSKLKPAASSTPNTNGLKSQRVTTASQNTSKSTITCNLSPVSLNSSKKSERTKSPLKKPSTPRKSENAESSRLPRYSPQPVRVCANSFSELKNSKTPQPSSSSLKVVSEKVQRQSSVLSPLRNSNKLATKTKSVSLMPRLSKSIVPKSGPEKENYT